MPHRSSWCPYYKHPSLRATHQVIFNSIIHVIFIGENTTSTCQNETHDIPLMQSIWHWNALPGVICTDMNGNFLFSTAWWYLIIYLLQSVLSLDIFLLGP